MPLFLITIYMMVGPDGSRQDFNTLLFLMLYKKMQEHFRALAIPVFSPIRMK